MAFKLSKSPSFTAKITVETPNDKAGFDRATFIARFKRASTDEAMELQKLIPKDVMARVLIGWDDFLEEDGTPVPFGDDTVWALLSDPPALLALNDAFWKTIVKSKEKN